MAIEDHSSTPFTNRKAGEAFLIDPSESDGPGVLVLHSWWGLNEWTRDFCRRLAKCGYTALAPDLFNGKTPETAEAAEQTLAERNVDEMSGLVMSSAQTLRMVSADANAPIGVVGFSMGGSLAFWLSARLTTVVAAAVSFYGSQPIDFDSSMAYYQGHFAESDDYVSDDDKVFTESSIRLSGKETEFYTYPGTQHWFFENGPNYNPAAAELAWRRTIDFLDRILR